MSTKDTKVDLQDLSPELRKQVMLERRAARDQERQRARVERLSAKVARMGKRLLELQRRAMDKHDELSERAASARDEIHRLLGMSETRRPLGKSFISEDGLYRMELLVRSENALDEVKAAQAKTLVDDVIMELQAGENSDLARQLIGFLTDVFTKHKQRITYNWAVHDFLSRRFNDLRLVQAQDLIREAIIVTEPYYQVRHWRRAKIGAPWVLVPITFRRKADIETAEIERRRRKKRGKEHANKATAESAA